MNANTIKIDRSNSFNAVEFLRDGNIFLVSENELSVSITEVDINSIELVNMLKAEEELISGEENLKRLLGAGYIPLDAKIMEILWEKEIIPEDWKRLILNDDKYDQYNAIHFDGTLISDYGKNLMTLCLGWSKTHRCCDALCGFKWKKSRSYNDPSFGGRKRNDFSAVIRKG